MSRRVRGRLFGLGRTLCCSLAYDNFDVNARTDAPTLERDSQFIHAASATLIPLSHGVTVDDLQCSQEVYTKTGLDEHNTPGVQIEYTYRDLLPTPRKIAPLPRRVGTDPRVPRTIPRSGHFKRQQWHMSVHSDGGTRH
jgi:hypothetical protein